MRLLILIPLALMVLSDYKSRTVVLWQLLLFGAAVLATGLVENGLKATATNMAVNLIMFLLTCVCVYAYFSIKYKSARSIIGRGDIVFILLLTPLFAPRLFLVFMTVSFAATLLVWLTAAPVRKSGGDIPLVSGVGVCLAIFLVCQQLM